jgi:hypothetical protein
MSSLTGNYTDGHKFYKNSDGDICFKNIDGSYLSVARSMPIDKLLDLENQIIPTMDCVINSNYTIQSKHAKIIKRPVFRQPKQKILKQSKVINKVNKVNKVNRGKTQFFEFAICTFCECHHSDDTDECSDCISNYEKDMKYTKETMISLEKNLSCSCILSSLKDIMESDNFRGFRFIDLDYIGFVCYLGVYFIDYDNKMAYRKISHPFNDIYDDDYYHELYEELQYSHELEYEDYIYEMEMQIEANNEWENEDNNEDVADDEIVDVAEDEIVDVV